jgi:predicted signal transduction protein with EAL and GGDEF domain
MPVAVGAEKIDISSSIGLAMFPDDRLDVVGLLHAADQAMYEAKYAGGGAVQLHSSLRTELTDA